MEVRATLEQRATLVSLVNLVRLVSLVKPVLWDNLEPPEAPVRLELQERQARLVVPVPLDHSVYRGFPVRRVLVAPQELPEMWAQLGLLVVQDSRVSPDSLEQQDGRAPQVPRELQVQQAQQVLRAFPALLDLQALQEELEQQDYRGSSVQQEEPGLLV